MADRTTTADLAGSVVRHLLDRPPTLGASRLLAVDGPAGSGKTTLALACLSQLRASGLRAVSVAMDDLYDGWTGLTPELAPRVLKQVLGPLAADRPARWQRYDWAAGAFAEWRDLTPPDVVVLEGCGSGARAYASYRTLLVWVETDLETRRRRAFARDGPEIVSHWAAWTELEERHFAANDTRRRADVALGTEPRR